MVYSKQAWTDGPGGNTAINAARLGYIEEGIKQAHDQVATWPVAYLRQTVAQGPFNNGWYNLHMGVAEIDTHTGWVVGTPERWTCPTGQAGIYRVCASANASIPASAWNLTRILKNGSVLAGSWAAGGGHGTGGGGASYAERIVSLAVGDYVSAQIYSDNASFNTRVTADGAASWLAIERIR